MPPTAPINVGQPPHEEPPSFNEWISYCFRHGNADFWELNQFSDADRIAAQMRTARFLQHLSPIMVSEYLIRFMESPVDATTGVTDDELADGVQFIFGGGSGYVDALFEQGVPADFQRRLYQALPSLYLKLLDPRCTASRMRSTDPTRLDGAVLMLWDMSGGGLDTPVFDHSRPGLLDAAFESLESILLQSESAACQMSVLHGLGHLHCNHAARSEAIIDWYLRERRPPVELRQFAQLARDGCV